MKSLPPGFAFLVGMGSLTVGLAIFAAYLMYRSNQVSPKGMVLIAVPLMAIGLLLFLIRGKRE